MIRPYTPNDREAILQIFNQNVPDFFAPSELKDLIHYLDHELEDYFVYEEDGALLGAGGINYFPEERKAYISWDFVADAAKGRGIGSQLVTHRLQHIQDNPTIQQIIVRTSQLAYRFYEKCGFTLKETQKNYWAEGFDLYYMEFLFSPQSMVHSP